MNVNDLFPGSYLKADELGSARPTVTIERVVTEDIGGDQKPVVFFKGKTKGLVLNKTNALHIAEIAGSTDTDDWGGTVITLYATKTEFQGKRVPCIRIAEVDRPAPKRAPVVEPSDADDDGIEVPF